MLTPGQTSAQAFVQRLLNDASLQTHLATLSSEEAIQWAHENGYTFTKEEMEQTLSDAELAGISGGLNIFNEMARRLL